MYLLTLIIFLLTVLIFLIAYFQWKYLYWWNKNVPYIQPQFPFGTVDNPFNKKHNPAIQIQHQYEYLKSLGHAFGGLYSIIRPSLLTIDLELIKNVLLKDFQYFMDRGVYYNEKSEPLSANLFSLEGDRWRYLRTRLTPTFTSGKIKMMLQTLIDCGSPMITTANEIVSSKKPVDIKDFVGRFTTDTIGSCAFGLECNSFKENEDDFRKYGKTILSFGSKIQIIKAIIISAFPTLAKYCGLTFFNSESNKFFFEIVKNTVAHRRNSGVDRNDFIQLLMNLKSGDNGGKGLTIEQIAAQAFIFWFAGFETSSTTMGFCLYELAINQDIQNKVRKEIITILEEYQDDLSYNAVSEMKYLNQVIDETLRKYPASPLLFRICVEDYPLPNTNIVLKKGTRVTIPVYAIHHDPDYFPNPERFDPERFGEGNRSNIPSFAYMPFGEGPRICIGLRFGLLQTKVGLILLLKNFKFLLNSRTGSPLKFDLFNFILSAEGSIWLDMERILKSDT